MRTKVYRREYCRQLAHCISRMLVAIAHRELTIEARADSRTASISGCRRPII
ncbi:MAG: hypothetical protein AAFQ40_17760 [Cyanobacteria bacterium J06623_5]